MRTWKWLVDSRAYGKIYYCQRNFAEVTYFGAQSSDSSIPADRSRRASQARFVVDKQLRSVCKRLGFLSFSTVPCVKRSTDLSRTRVCFSTISRILRILRVYAPRFNHGKSAVRLSTLITKCDVYIGSQTLPVFNTLFFFVARVIDFGGAFQKPQDDLSWKIEKCLQK